MIDIREDEIEQQNLNKNLCIISGIEWKWASNGGTSSTWFYASLKGTFSAAISYKAKYQREKKEKEGERELNP